MDSLAVPGLLEALTATNNFGIAVVDGRGVCTWTNQVAQHVLGAPSDIHGKAWSDVLPRASSGSPTVVFGHYELEIQTTPLGPTAEAGTLVTFRDVTAERQASRRLAAFHTGVGLVPYSGSLSATLDVIARDVVEASGASACQIMRVDPSDGTPRIAAHAGMPAPPADYGERLTECGRRGASLKVRLAMERQVPIIEHHQRERLLKDAAWEPLRDYLGCLDWDTFVTVPLVHRGRTLGALNGFYPAGVEPTHDDVSFFVALSDQVSVALHIAELSAELHGETTQLERERIASDLHDSVCQSLYSLTLHMGAADLALAGGTPDGARRAQRELGVCRELADATLAEMRALIFESRAGAVADIGLVAGIRRLAEAPHIRSAVVLELDLPAEPIELPHPVAEHVYRVVQEATTNAAKHADASQVTITVVHQQNQLTVTIEDDGHGFRIADVRTGFGLSMMAERARKIGAVFRIERSERGGTLVRLMADVGR